MALHNVIINMTNKVVACARRVADLRRRLREVPTVPKGRIGVLFVGYDFKFAQAIIEHFQSNEQYFVMVYEVDFADPDRERLYAAYLNRTDWIFAEWALEQAAWFSHHKLPHQKLVVRGHRFEAVVPDDQLPSFNWSNVNAFVTVSPEWARIFQRNMSIPDDILSIIPNYADCDALDEPKLPDADFIVGLVGAVPSRKRLDLALDFIETLHARDQRYKLIVKGHSAETSSATMNDVTEIAIYHELLERVDQTSLKECVIFEGHTPSMPEFYAKCGWVLSTSDNESFHLTISDGMASGAIPLIRNWDGADEIYPAKYVYGCTDEMAEAVIAGVDASESQEVKQFIRQRYDKPLVLKQFEDIFR